MAKVKSMPVKNIYDEPVYTSDNYHKGRSAAITCNGVDIIITAKDDRELAIACRKIMSPCFGLDFDLVKDVVVFGVWANCGGQS